ncbi:flagellar basal-body MS-ring/collar protein FliF [Acidocella aromatica]|uniref:Flagellar M-ring protein FliF n=1 Tax=Acidocella aromatica TaxID=1303579 RepID=A0A840VD16_9PROT|nr:flagellar basal-body MS-ring/collar protein FliF [Acidocella aromatica]MBB5373743.1 flagellar M-ring protein FliF [Acidocella aromatica]
MQDWRQHLARLREWAAKLPKILWVAAAVILVSLGAVLWLEMSGPPYAVLSEGLSPADGGKVIAQLQKLGIPYQLQAAGNIILVPAPQLAQARLQLGQAQVPGSDVQTAWSQLENAPMTASDLAQSTMAMQALQLSLQQSIQSMSGIRSAQVFLAMPPDTPFLADQPKPTGSVVIDADAATAQAQGEAIANLVAGAVPGLAANSVTVETTSGVTVFPVSGAMATGAQLATQAQVEAQATARIAGLLIPLVGAGNFQANVSANLDFTQEHIHQIAYGPGHLVEHQTSSQSTQYGSHNAAIGIPGALSNEPPSPTTASASAAPAQPTTGSSTGGSSPSAPQQPSQSNSNLDQSYVVDQSENDITNPDWSVKSVAVSVVVNKAALGNAVTVDQVKAAIAGAFAYPNVTVNVLEASFQKPATGIASAPLVAAANPLTRALLEVMAAAALLFGLALPVGRRLANVNIQELLPPPPPRPIPVVLPPRDFSELRDQAAENIPGVARLLQSWVEENE